MSAADWMPDQDLDGGRKAFWAMRKRVAALAEDLSKFEKWVPGNLDGRVEYIGVAKAVELFDERFSNDRDIDRSIDDGLWNIGQCPDFYALLRNRNDDAELGRLVADACNMALIQRCVDDGFDETDEMRRNA